MSVGAFLASLVIVVAAGCSTLSGRSQSASLTPTNRPPVETTPATVAPSIPDRTPTATPSALTATDDAGFPATALGLPVISIGEVNDLISSGALDGRLAAVRGYWIQTMIPSCPAPNRWYSPLEDYCSFQTFSDTPYLGAECHEIDQGTACNGNAPPAGAQTIRPRLLDNYMNNEVVRSADFRHFVALPVVVIGHAGDPRYVQCQADARSECRRTFVVDSIVWADGKSYAPGLYDDPYALKPTMSMDEIQQIARSTVVSVALVRARDAQAIDPRIHLTGDEKVWVIRTQHEQSDEPAQAADVMAIDDASGASLATLPLALPDGFAPALLKTQAKDPTDCCGDDELTPFFQLTDDHGRGVAEELVGGGMVGGSDDGGSRWYPGAPVVLDPGHYDLEAWHAKYTGNDTWGEPHDNCTTSLTVTRAQELRMETAFPESGACTWQAPTFPESAY